MGLIIHLDVVGDEKISRPDQNSNSGPSSL